MASMVAGRRTKKRDLGKWGRILYTLLLSAIPRHKYRLERPLTAFCWRSFSYTCLFCATAPRCGNNPPAPVAEAFHRAPWSPPKQSTMAAAEYPTDIIDTRDNTGIIDTRDTTDIFHPVPIRRVIKSPVQRKTKANNDRPSRPVPFPASLTPAAPSTSFTLGLSASSTSSIPLVSATGPTSGHYSSPRFRRVPHTPLHCSFLP